MAFGLDVEGYRTVFDSVMSLLQLLLGVFDYDALWRSNRALSPLLFLAFTVVVVFILLNIFLAIIHDAFAVVHAEKAHAQDLSSLFRGLFYKKVLRRQVTKHARPHWPSHSRRMAIP